MANLPNKFDAEKLGQLILRSLDGSASDADVTQLNSILRSSTPACEFYLEFIETYASISQVSGGTESGFDTGEFESVSSGSKVADSSNVSLRGVDIEEYMAEVDHTGAEDSEMTRAIFEILELERASSAVEIEKPASVKPKRELIQKVESDFKWFPGRPSKRKLRFLAAMAASIIVTIGYLYFFAPKNEYRPVVAKLSDSIEAVWDPEFTQPDEYGDMIQSKYSLKKGYASILFYEGASLTVESPAEFSLNNTGDMELFSGRIYAVVPEKAQGFTVKAGVSRIVDLGTEFGVEVDKTGNTQLHVTKGGTMLFAGLLKGKKEQVEVREGSAKKVYSDGFVKDIELEDRKFARRINSKSNLVERDRSVEVVYEPFDYPTGKLKGQAGASEIGFEGLWDASEDTSVVGGSVEFGRLAVKGGSIQKISKRDGIRLGWRKISTHVLADSGMLDDGATLWFSLIMGFDISVSNHINARLAFALANNRFSGPAFAIEDEGQEPGSGLGVTLGRISRFNGEIAASEFGRPTGKWLADINYGTYDESVSYQPGENALVVGKIVWGKDSDTIEIYIPDENFNLGSVISTLQTSVNQSAFDTMTFYATDKVVLDEIRFGKSYSDVLGRR